VACPCDHYNCSFHPHGVFMSEAFTINHWAPARLQPWQWHSQLQDCTVLLLLGLYRYALLSSFIPFYGPQFQQLAARSFFTPIGPSDPNWASSFFEQFCVDHMDTLFYSTLFNFWPTHETLFIDSGDTRFRSIWTVFSAVWSIKLVILKRKSLVL